MTAGSAPARGALFGACLGFVAGFVDTAAFLALGGLFTAHVTGNLVILGARLGRQNTEGAWLRLLLLPVFVVAVAGTHKLARRARATRWGDVATLLILEGAILLVAAAVAQATSVARLAPDAQPVLVIACLAVAAMGMQNAMMRQTFGGQSATTVMTGNVTQLALDAVEYSETARADHAARAAVVARLRKVGATVAGFVTGAAAGAASVALFGLGMLSVPAVMLVAMGVQELRARGPNANQS